MCTSLLTILRVIENHSYSYVLPAGNRRNDKLILEGLCEAFVLLLLLLLLLLSFVVVVVAVVFALLLLLLFLTYSLLQISTPGIMLFSQNFINLTETS